MGRAYSPSRLPKKPLVIWGFEGSPYYKVSWELEPGSLHWKHRQMTTGCVRAGSGKARVAAR